MKYPSKKELDEQKQEYSLLPAEDYLLRVGKIEEATQLKYQSVDEEEDILRIQLEVLSFRDGEQAVDIDGKPAEKRIIFFTGRPASMGFQQDGTPSKTRALVAYATGQDIYGEIELESWEQLLGLQVCAEIVQKPNTKGQVKNVVARFLAPKGKRPTVKSMEKVSEEIPTVEDYSAETGEPIPPNGVPFS